MEADKIATLLGEWREMSGCDESFWASGVQVHVGEHQIAPDGYVGVVGFGEAVVVAVRPAMVDLVGEANFVSVDPATLTTVETMTALLGPPAAMLGPAVLAFRSSSVPLRESNHSVVGPLPFDDPLVQQVVDAADPAEVEESSLGRLPSGLYVAVDTAGVGMSACGFVPFGSALGHLGVLTARSARGYGWGRASATAAIAAVHEAGLIPQWRALESNAPSIGLARSLGFELLGRQLSFKPQTP